VKISALPTLAPRALFAGSHPPCYPIDRVDGSDGHARLYYLARNGLYHGLSALGIGSGDAVLMPAYHHGVEVEAVRHTGATVEMYRVTRDMTADLDDARRLARQGRRVRVLYLIHYAGFPQPVEEARALCRERGLYLVEDCALALFSRDPSGRPLGAGADLSLFCLYKTLPVPHGGIAVANCPLPSPSAAPLGATLHHLGGSLLENLEISGGLAARALRRGVQLMSRSVVDKVVPKVQTGTQHLRPAELPLGAHPIVRAMLRTVDAERIATRRRHNYSRLLAQLGEQRAVPAGPLPEGAVPLFFPLAVSDRRRALAELSARQVDAIDFWSVGDRAANDPRFGDVRWLRRHVIEIPIHQDLDDAAIDRVALAVKEVLAHG
jgi:dTDP-4-amino-4,6-dideoxygalactose transaminase